jgi:hypothetical protein
MVHFPSVLSVVSVLKEIDSAPRTGLERRLRQCFSVIYLASEVSSADADSDAPGPRSGSRLR